MNTIETHLTPYEDRVLVLPDEAPEMASKTMVTPDQIKALMKPATGTVVKVGPGIPARPHYDKLRGHIVNGHFTGRLQLDKDEVGEPVYSYTAMPVKPGDKVYFSKTAGLELKDKDDNTFLCMRVTDLWAKD